MLVGEGLEQSDQLVLTLPEYPQKGMAVQIAKRMTTPKPSYSK